MHSSDTAATQRITVTIDRELEDIVPTFLANRLKDLQTLRTSVSLQDYETIRVLGHRLKGDGGGYGFPALSEMGGAMELAAGRHDQPAIERIITQLEDYLARVTVVYR
jgi:HPt (histidine-containing phosphotransfer) domain-containing protein